MRPRVKICGITNAHDAMYCATAGADALGFIFYEASPRYITPSDAAAIIRGLPPFVTPVGVFVNASRTMIGSVIGETGIRAVQLSGDESPADCRGYSVSVIKAFRMSDPSEAARTKEYEISAAMLDGGTNGVYGGSGRTPDLAVAERIRQFHPLIFAGGLNPGNIVEIIRRLRPYGVDVNSGVERSPGIKDHEKVQQLFDRLSLPTESAC